jgi:hypothetical protein
MEGDYTHNLQCLTSHGTVQNSVCRPPRPSKGNIFRGLPTPYESPPNKFRLRENLDVSRAVLPGLPLRYCVQLCMAYIDQPSWIPEPYDLASSSIGRTALT